MAMLLRLTLRWALRLALMTVLRPGLLAAVMVLAALAQMLPAQTLPATSLTPDQMRRTALLALNGDQPAVALQVSTALVARDPQDFEALLLQARAARDLGRYDLAQTAAQHAWTIADSDLQRHAAALIRAQALASAGRRTAAQIWLRRAVQHAPDAASRARAIRDFRYVRARNPLAVTLRFGLAPTSNINNGAARSSARLFGLPFEVQLTGAARALSGIEAQAGGTLRYRISESRRHATDLQFSLDNRAYRLSAEARAIAPAAKGSDFAQTVLATGVMHRWTPDGARSERQLGLEAGRLWYGGDPYADFLRGTAGLSMPLAAGARINLGVTAEANRGPAAPWSDATRLSLGWQGAPGNMGRLSLSAALTDSRSDVPSADYADLTLGVDYALARPLFGAEATVSLDLRGRHYPVTPLAPGPRDDREIAAALQLAFVRAEYLGFAPVVTLSARQSNSTVDLYDIRDIGLSVGFRSAF